MRKNTVCIKDKMELINKLNAELKRKNRELWLNY